VLDNPVLLIAVLIPSVILHEVAHGVVALWFGDDTAQRAGRLTLNPVAHVDLFGTILLPALLAISGGTVFGYAKPVPTRPSQMRDPRNHGLVTSLAGPATNVVLAVLAALAIRMSPVTLDGTVGQTLLTFGVVNVVLAAFNLIPLPPLDGAAVVQRFLPQRWLPGWLKLRRYSMFLVLGVVLLVPGALAGVFRAALDLWATLL
jgi:Zn-dependent protease